jgi:hypothetical protein
MHPVDCGMNYDHTVIILYACFRENWIRYNAADLCFGDTRFESRLEHCAVLGFLLRDFFFYIRTFFVCI